MYAEPGSDTAHVPQGTSRSLCHQRIQGRCGRGDVEALKTGSPARALAISGEPCRAWQELNKLGFVTGLLGYWEDDKQEAWGGSTWHQGVRPGRGHQPLARELLFLLFIRQLVLSILESCAKMRAC